MKRFTEISACHPVCLLLLFLGCVAAAHAEQPKQLTLELAKGVTMKMALIPAGEFMMGSKLTPEQTAKAYGGRAANYANEHPRHKVKITEPFYMGVFEVTQSQWEAVMDTKPYDGKMVTKIGPDYPAGWVHWEEASEFCRKLSKKIGKTVALPTEAQWEYACRAGSDTVFCYGDDPEKLSDYGWWRGNMVDGKKDKSFARKGGLKKPNAWGLYDIHGNVWEWCRDWYSKDFYASGKNVAPVYSEEGKTRTVRGGSWYNGATNLRSAGRNSWCGPKYRHYNYGFRAIMTAVAPKGSSDDPTAELKPASHLHLR